MLVQGNILLNGDSGVHAHASHSVIFGDRIENCGEGLVLDSGNGPGIHGGSGKPAPKFRHVGTRILPAFDGDAGTPVLMTREQTGPVAQEP